MPEPAKNDNKKHIVDPATATYIQLDDIASSLLDIITLLKNQQETITSMNGMMLDSKDEGEYYIQEETANPNTFNIIDFLGILGFPVKGYYISNDNEDNTILFGHNITGLSIDASVRTADARFITLRAGEENRFRYDPKKIKNIYIKSVGGAAAYRLTAVW